MSVRDQRGFTVAEVLIAAVVVTIALVALANVVPLASYGVREGNQLSTANFLADQRLEQVKGLPWVSTPANDCLGVSTGNAAPAVPGGASCKLGGTTVSGGNALPWEADEAAGSIAGFPGYSRAVRVTDCAVAACAGIADARMRRVTVTVTYTPLAAAGVAATPKSAQAEMIVSRR